MIDTLANICRDNLLTNKLLLVPSYTIGQNIIDKLSAKMPVLNIRLETIQRMAIEIGMPLLSANNINFADDNISSRIMFGIIYNMQKNNEFEYFDSVQITPSISNSIWNAVMEIKHACLNYDNLNGSCFVSEKKGRDIKKITAAYDFELKKQGLVDYPALLQMALENRYKEDVLLLVPNSLKLRLLEKKLIAAKFSSIKILYDEPLNGISAPDSYYCANYPEKPAYSSPFVNLYALDENNEQADLSNIQLIKAYGESNEIETVFRDIKVKGMPFDNVCIYAASNEPYAQLLYQKAKQLGIPITFGYGINIQNSRLGKVFNAIIQWIGSDYQVTELINMLYQELIQIPGQNGGNINSYQAANILRASGIGWGRERYLSVLDDSIKYMQKENSKDVEYKVKRIKILTSVKQFITSLFNEIPDTLDGKVSLNELAKGISAFISEFVQVKSKLDAEAKTTVTESLNSISQGVDLSIDIDEALCILKSNIQYIRIGSSGPENGHIHLVSFDNGFYTNRQYNYFIGLDADRFPGNPAEDAILLDVEKQKLSNHIIQNHGKISERIYKMVELLSGLKGNITFIYSSFDPAENRDKIPSSFILQVYRMISQNESADYSDLKNYFTKTEGYITENPIDESEFWLHKYYKIAGTKDITEPVFECYPHLKQGTGAWGNQAIEKFTHYDGYIGNLGIETDEKIFSASKLELLAKCPYQYFLRYVLNISPPDELVYDPEIWLDSLQKGSLYHTIFERFYKAISERKEKPNREKHSALIIDIAQKAINELKAQIPPPNEIVFDNEKREILESCLIFLAGEEENSDNGTPVEFELGFGIDKEGYPPVEVTLPSHKKFLLSGKIDRIDEMGENLYRIIDYKSGSTYGYSDREFFKGGRQIQHALYAYACEVLLGNNKGVQNAKVTEGVYLFPTKKGEGKRFIRVQEDMSKFFQLLDDLFTVIEEGTFAATEDSGDCRWCEYQVVCRIHRLQKVIAEKRSDQSVEALSALRRLATYE